jgi:hypothetical protein
MTPASRTSAATDTEKESVADFVAPQVRAL